MRGQQALWWSATCLVTLSVQDLGDRGEAQAELTQQQQAL